MDDAPPGPWRRAPPSPSGTWERGWMTESALAESLVTAARALQRETGSQDTLDRVAQLAVQMVDGCRHAGISLNRRGVITSPATSDPVVQRVDELQYEFDQGPCLDAIRQHEWVHSADLAHDPRWPVWGPRTVEETGIRSMMAFRLFAHHDVVGALNLYSTEPGSFDEHDRDTGAALAAHAALAVVSSQKIENLEIALDSRTVIGQAVGIVMERFDLEPDRAFAVLSRLSQDLNRKVRDVAQELVVTRTMPGG
ncbi:Anaerobic nitric oxide reductase transcription regulator NorR [Nocardioides aquaticus]|uniref:Anaerobic nitric oxide reductase transcription regulator NorR n=2 Tax=Nocardioides aquaticus TaxID=160826 RepID=A0ABX8EH33_9ACTN|nr:Anaerobic nitric oxide reductase transcription regulator NorR [Nocardioides aquaticus]